MKKAEQKGSISMDEVMTNPTVEEIRAETEKESGKKRRGRKPKATTPSTPTLSQRLEALQPDPRTGVAALVEIHYEEIKAALARNVKWDAIAAAFAADGHKIQHKSLAAIYGKIRRDKGEALERKRKPKAENAEAPADNADNNE